MNIKIRGEKIEVTSAMKKHVMEKLAKLDKYFEEPNSIQGHVLVKTKGTVESIEVTIPTIKFTLRAEERHKDFYSAVDLVVNKLEGQIRKNKSKLKKKYKDVEPISFNLDIEEDGEQQDVKIIKRKDMTMKPMDEEEAIIQAELLNHDFFIFKNVDEECVSVLYKRKDNFYGIINVK